MQPFCHQWKKICIDALRLCDFCPINWISVSMTDANTGKTSLQCFGVLTDYLTLVPMEFPDCLADSWHLFIFFPYEHLGDRDWSWGSYRAAAFLPKCVSLAKCIIIGDCWQLSEWWTCMVDAGGVIRQYHAISEQSQIIDCGFSRFLPFPFLLEVRFGVSYLLNNLVPFFWLIFFVVANRCFVLDPASYWNKHF